MTWSPRVLLFYLPHLVAAFLLSGLLKHGPAIFRLMFWVFAAAPYIDWIVGIDRTDPPLADSHTLDESPLWKLAVWSWIPIQASLLLSGLLTVRDLSLAGAVMVGIGVGMTAGIFGVTAAHELMHGSGPVHRTAAEFLLALFSYPHFAIEHVHGHHRNVGTRLDPATARLGESLYAFLPRTVIGGLRGVWRIETRRLRLTSSRISLLRSRLVQHWVLLAVAYGLVAYLMGTNAVVMMAVQSGVAVFLLETLNYVGHYGLVRGHLVSGRIEPVRPWHSWNSSHRLSNWLLFNVGRHSDHHCESGRSGVFLRHESGAPQLPGGYFAMFVLALFPPLWRRVMHPLLPPFPQTEETALGVKVTT